MITALTDLDVKSFTNSMDRDSCQQRLNLGCGSRFREGWTNVDIASSGPGVIAHDLRLPFPFDDQSFDLVYHSHVLEHFDREGAKLFLKECFRVLRPDGLIRVAVPDLEAIVRCYLSLLERGLRGDPIADDYDWILLELFDQIVRERSGGQMGDWLRRSDIPNADFVLRRIGTEARNIMNGTVTAPPASTPPTPSLPRRVAAGIRHRLSPARICRHAIRRILGKDYEEALRIGRFRRRGEVHQWMYDRYSLARLLTSVGFAQPVCQTANKSQIADWSRWQLDSEPDGSIYKPDSLFMEANKPST